MSSPSPSEQKELSAEVINEDCATTVADDDDDDEQERVLIPTVTFFPPLHDARRAWILSRLREEHVSSVLDIGCGEGSLLTCLCNPPAFLLKTDKYSKNEEEKSSTIYSSSCDGLPDLHISRLAGLDISMRALKHCAVQTAPTTDSDYRDLPRWEPMEVKLWLGSLDVYNPEFVDVECIVSTEVIEHLPDDVLSAFAPTLLGLYRPRLLLITTPNYAFNARFSAPGRVDPGGFPDPTQRTDRVFRHHDHKFEWTPAEFRDWCIDAASTWGYTVEVSAIGLPNGPDLWGRDVELGCASQVALFRQIDGWQGQRPVAPLNPAEESAHKLLETHIHSAHPQAGKAESHDKVCEVVSKYMESYYFDDGYSVWDLWVENTISIACGGRLDVLLDAIVSSPALSISRTEGAPAREWNIKFAGDKHKEVVEAMKKTHYWKRNSPQSSWGRDGDGGQSQGGGAASNWPETLLDCSGGAEWPFEEATAAWMNIDVGVVDN